MSKPNHSTINITHAASLAKAPKSHHHWLPMTGRFRFKHINNNNNATQPNITQAAKQFENALKKAKVPKDKQANFFMALSKYLNDLNTPKTFRSLEPLTLASHEILISTQKPVHKANVLKALKEMFSCVELTRPYPTVRCNAYVSRTGKQRITPDPHSSVEKKYFDLLIKNIEDHTGIQANPLEQKTKDQIETITETWLNLIAPTLEEPLLLERLENNTRSHIYHEQGGHAQLSSLLKARASVCRELSVIGSILFTAFGIPTRLGLGRCEGNNLEVRSGNHVWVKCLDEQGQILKIVDSNALISTYDDFETYTKRCSMKETSC